ncbi:fimbrial protein [Escherichia coli]|nr:fimbrial protein [Escherichia coli]EEW1871719.1 fimbrial protein [Escherichia coli]MKZ04601.1 fimbrial protein [Escherichia coli]
MWWITNETDLTSYAVELLLHGALKCHFSRLFSAAA